MFRCSLNPLVYPLRVSLFALLVSIPSARADAIDAVTQTPSGTDTTFTITGVYPAGTPATPFSSPNGPYSLTFTLPTTPTSFAFMDPAFEIFGIDASIAVNGVHFGSSMVVFFPSSFIGGAGFLACLGVACNPDPNVLPYPAANFWDIAGTVYSGSPSNPTFLAGAINFNPGVSRLVVAEPTAVPEATSVFLVAAGLLVIGGLSRIRLRFG